MTSALHLADPAPRPTGRRRRAEQDETPNSPGEGTEGAFKEAARRGTRLGLQLHYHAIGDAAMRLSLDAVEAAEEAASRKAIRAEIAHNFWIGSIDLPRFGRLGVVAVDSPRG
jgi:predicted amidohydrolase YtcJ